jgi:hypothetical protein
MLALARKTPYDPDHLIVPYMVLLCILVVTAKDIVPVAVKADDPVHDELAGISAVQSHIVFPDPIRRGKDLDAVQPMAE